MSDRRAAARGPRPARRAGRRATCSTSPRSRSRAGETLVADRAERRRQEHAAARALGLEPPAAGELLFRGERVPAGAAVAGLPPPDGDGLPGAAALRHDGLRERRLRPAAARRRDGARSRGGSRECLERFGIAHLADRSARTLSGGEAQRTSLARALAVEPEVLLLDEPFAALDPPTREALIDDLARTLRETGTTTVFVTHDRDEARALADRVAVLDRRASCGRSAPPEEVCAAPADTLVAAFVGVENLLPVTLRSAVTSAGDAGEPRRGVARDRRRRPGDDLRRRRGCSACAPRTSCSPRAGGGGGTPAGNCFPGRSPRWCPQGPLMKGHDRLRRPDRRRRLRARRARARPRAGVRGHGRAAAGRTSTSSRGGDLPVGTTARDRSSTRSSTLRRTCRI